MDLGLTRIDGLAQKSSKAAACDIIHETSLLYDKTLGTPTLPDRPHLALADAMLAMLPLLKLLRSIIRCVDSLCNLRLCIRHAAALGRVDR